eukprot:6184976-Pleurochrysis_carterae.AAC.1
MSSRFTIKSGQFAGLKTARQRYKSCLKITFKACADPRGSGVLKPWGRGLLEPWGSEVRVLGSRVHLCGGAADVGELREANVHADGVELAEEEKPRHAHARGHVVALARHTASADARRAAELRVRGWRENEGRGC